MWLASCVGGTLQYGSNTRIRPRDGFYVKMSLDCFFEDGIGSVEYFKQRNRSMLRKVFEKSQTNRGVQQ